jgi:hypothetical protein
LQRPEVFLNTSGDVNLLPKILEAAEKAQAVLGDIATTNKQMQELAASATMQPLFV